MMPAPFKGPGNVPPTSTLQPVDAPVFVSNHRPTPGDIPIMTTTNAPTTLDTILTQFRDDARNNRDLGDRFERMIQQFLRVDLLQARM